MALCVFFLFALTIALVANANQTAVQKVEQEAAQEFMRGNGHKIFNSAGLVISPGERNVAIMKLHESVVGDGDAMGIVSQIVQDLV